MTYFPAKIADRSADTVIGAAQMGVTDNIMLLPQAAEDKLDLLRRQKADFFALVRPLDDEQNDLIGQRQAASMHLNRHRADGHGEIRNVGTLQLVDKIAKLDKNLERVRRLLEQRRANQASAVGLVHNVENYLKQAQRKGSLTAFTGEVNVPKGDPAKVLARTRETIAELRADRHKVRSAPFPSSVAKAYATSLIDELAARGRPSVAALLENVRHIEWKSAASMRWEYGNLIEGSVVAGVQLVAWLERDRLLAALYAEIDEMADDKNALTEEERTAELARIEAQALELERIEEHLVEELGVERRPDADPRAVLHIDGPVPTQEI